MRNVTEKIHQQHPWVHICVYQMSRLPSLEAEFKGTAHMKALALPPNINAHLLSKAIPSNGSTYHLSTRWSTKLLRWWQGRWLVTLFLLHSQGKSGSAPWPGVHSQARLSLLLPPSDKLGMSTPLLWKIAWCMAENKTQYIQCFLAFPVSPKRNLVFHHQWLLIHLSVCELF